MLGIIFFEDGFFWQVPEVSVGNCDHQNGKTLSPVFEKSVSLAFLTISVVPGNELEGLVHKQHGQGELEDNDPLVKRQSGDVEDNLQKSLFNLNYLNKI